MPEPTERWLPVVGLEGLYEVSDLGRVRSVDRVVRDGRTPDGVRHLKGKIRKPSFHVYGYPQVHLSRHGRSMHLQVHSAVLTAFVGLCPDGMEALHGSRGCRDSSLSNLRWGTKSENMLDKRRDGTDHHVNKERCPRRHLYVGPNLKLKRYKLVDGTSGAGRECRACRQAEGVVSYARCKGWSVPDLDAVADAKYEKIMRNESIR